MEKIPKTMHSITTSASEMIVSSIWQGDATIATTYCNGLNATV